MKTRSLFFRALLATLVLPGTNAVLIPLFIAWSTRADVSNHWWLLLGAFLIAGGATIMFLCIWEFASEGRGTLAPVDPPKNLIVGGLYRYMRNPMYVGVMGVLLGEAILFSSLILLIYAAIWFSVVNVFIMVYEEPTLRRQFGAQYESYVRRVPRWPFLSGS